MGFNQHTPLLSRAELFWSHVYMPPCEDDCWLWIGAKSADGYGRFGARPAQGMIGSHRFSYELLVGPIPDDLQIDHLCRNHSCVNPAHMEPVTQRQNTLRGDGPTATDARKTHCLRGHTYDLLNTLFRRDGHRTCRECKRLRGRVSYKGVQ